MDYMGGSGTLNPAERSARCAGGIKLHLLRGSESFIWQFEVVSHPPSTSKYGAPRWGTPYFGAGGGTLNPAERCSATSCADKAEKRAPLAA